MSDFNPRLVQGKAMCFVGLRKHYAAENMNEVPAHWQAFMKGMNDIPDAVGAAAYGLVFDKPQGIDYMAAWQVSGKVSTPGTLPKGFTTAEMPAGQYAVFPHDGHVSKIHDTVDRIWRKWVPSARHKPVERPDTAYFFERYGEKFDPHKGEGDIEIWIPVS
jgi:AraC family transcriptional regulator